MFRFKYCNSDSYKFYPILKKTGLVQKLGQRNADLGCPNVGNGLAKSQRYMEKVKRTYINRSFDSIILPNNVSITPKTKFEQNSVNCTI